MAHQRNDDVDTSESIEDEKLRGIAEEGEDEFDEVTEDIDDVDELDEEDDDESTF